MAKFYLFFIIIFSQSLFSNDAFNYANELYEKGDYVEANKEYLNILDSDVKSSSLFMNIASSYAMIDEVGLALLFYERALKLKPFDKNIKRSIFYLKPSKYSDNSQMLILNLISSFLVIISLTITFVCFILFLLIKENKKILKNLTILSSVFTIICLSFSLYSKIEYNKDYIITLSDEARIYKGNSENASVISSPLEGSKLYLIDEYDDWYYIEIDLNKKGWVNKNYAKKI